MDRIKINKNGFSLSFFLIILAALTIACGPAEETADPQEDATTSETATLDEAIVEFEDISAEHQENPEYEETGAPPPGGPHHPAWQNCGVYLDPVEARHALHSLEHGAVWLTYNPDQLSEEEVASLQLLAGDQAYTILSPYPGLRSAVVLTAWGLQFDTNNPADSRIEEFLLTYQQGPQTPEPGAPCQGGLGVPRAPASFGVSTG